MKKQIALTLALCMLLLPALAEDGMVRIPRELYDQYRKLDTLLEIEAITQENFFEDYDVQSAVDGAAQGLLSSLGDPYTFFYTPEAYEKFLEQQDGRYAGIGIQISTNYETRLSTVSRVFAGSPAEAAGVMRGDILYRVEDLEVYPETINDAVGIMRGIPGTEVKVTFLRGEDVLEKTIARANIQINRVESCMLEENVGYIRLWEFSGDTAESFDQALDALKAQGMRALMLDLRDNPGGLLDVAISVSNRLIDGGILTYLVDRRGNRQDYMLKEGFEDVPVLALINEHSASCSEILAGALRDRRDAYIVGKNSFGKGVVQHLIPLDAQGHAMQLTVAQYFTPNGHEVHKVGIKPDHEVSLPEGDNGMYTLGDLADEQLRCAYEDMLRILEGTRPGDTVEQEEEGKAA